MQSVEEIRARAAELPAYDRRRVDGLLRALDVVIAAGGLVLLSPVLLLVGVAILVTSGQPLLYRGLRVGRDGRFFEMYKLRTLAADAESRLGPYYGAELSARTVTELTKLGAWLRAAQLDELPQLWNVLRGEMSMVGPRPIRPALFEQIVRETPESWQRLVIRPGLSGLAQTRIGRDEAWTEKLAHDLEYIADRSAALYLRGVGAMIRSFLAHVGAAVVGRTPTHN
jgi:lipopolysaccharide/colanic/teichoic acid biosynthesis glycosyltransferase